MAKKVFIVVGRHNYGKTRVIRDFFKKLVNIKETEHIFWINGKKGYIYSKSFEERTDEFSLEKLKESVRSRLDKYDYFVFPARSTANGEFSYFYEIKKLLEDEGVKVKSYEIKHSLDYRPKKECMAIAQKIHDFFSK